MSNAHAIESDRELLKLAAKAGGYSLSAVSDMIWSDAAVEYIQWNPLTDDGDALRLAADLSLLVKPGKHLGDGCTVEPQRSGIASCTCFRDDKREQMRRAIVNVAAEIGRSM